MLLRYNFTLTLQFSLLSRVGGQLGGWSEDWRVMLNSTQEQVEVEVRVELGNKSVIILLAQVDMGIGL